MTPAETIREVSRQNERMTVAPPDRTVELDEIVVELYTVPPTEFTAARTARARGAEKTLSAEIRAIAKPVVAAWVVDLMARDGLLGEAVALAAQLRDAQDESDAAEMTRLGRQRRQLVAALAAQGVSLAEQRGVAVSASARIDVEQTVNAAMIDADAAAAVLSGRLARPIAATGLGGVAVEVAISGSIPAAIGQAPTARPDELAQRRAQRAAERAAREAEREAVRAEQEHARIRAQHDRARERTDELFARIDSSRRDLARLEAEATAAEAERDRLERATATAEAAARAASQRATEVRGET